MTEAKNKIGKISQGKSSMLSMDLCLFKRYKMHGIEGMFG